MSEITWKRDIKGALAAGMKAVWFNPEKKKFRQKWNRAATALYLIMKSCINC